MSEVLVDYTEDGELHAVVRNKYKLHYGTLKEWGGEAKGTKTVDKIIPSEYFGVSVAGCAMLHAASYCYDNKINREGLQVHVSWRKDKHYPDSGSHTMLVDEFYVDVISKHIPPEHEEGILREVRTCTVMASMDLPPRVFAKVVKP
ncbi:MAG: hypothetical protein ACXABV_05825 [Candidatus Thorarchaeota archaeon]|jgi:uncharacterized OsmC-like protein